MTQTTTSRADTRHTHRAPAPSGGALTGLGRQLRLYGRLSRRSILIWTVAMGVLV